MSSYCIYSVIDCIVQKGSKVHSFEKNGQTKNNEREINMKLKKCEVMQEVEYLTEEKIKEALDRKCIKKWAYVLHDKDVYSKEEETKNPEKKAGAKKKAHWHVMIQFVDSQDTEYIAKWFGIKEEYVQKSHCSRFDPMLAYLIHANDSTKYQYKPDEVKANFDYVAFILEGTNSRKAEIIQQIKDGVIREFNYTQYITIYEYDKYKRAIENAFKFRRDAKYTGDRQLDVIYISGTSGSGKTTYAKHLCSQKGFSFFITGSGDDILDGYKGQDCIILDDVRSSSMRFSEFIKMLDNNSDSPVKSRYFNKTLTECKLLIITTIYELDKFYKMFNEQDEPLLQFKRRLNILVR